ncbi:MAG: hypothetical protein DPW12_10525 [Rhodocyclaceae bacterium]|nr:tetratricopeptide repeat protein [Candidatus Hydrogenedentota bacterium]MCG3167991.1 hypothetical protein [Bacteroidia bacterium]MCQ3924613.1 hypothetical protein [Rhodocyclaceae bacterium]
MPIAIITRAVIVPVQVLERKWPGGEAAYRAAAPNQTYRSDGHLAAIDFMTPGDVDIWIEESLKPAGLRFPPHGRERDVAVVDAVEGPTTPCEWLEFIRQPKWSEARLKGAPETALTGPRHWSPENEPEATYLDPETCGRRMRYIGAEPHLATFEDEETGQHNYVGMVSSDSLQLLLGWRLQALWERFSPLRGEADGNPAGLPDADRARLREAARECERIAQSAGPLESKALWLAALLARMASDWKLAERLCRLYLAGEPDDAGSWMELTWCLGEQGRHQEALEAAERAVALDSKNAGAAANMAACLRALGRRQEALEWAGKALELDPGDEIAHGLRDELLRTSNQAD